jgi:hypothetical protein
MASMLTAAAAATIWSISSSYNMEHQQQLQDGAFPLFLPKHL